MNKARLVFLAVSFTAFSVYSVNRPAGTAGGGGEPWRHPHIRQLSRAIGATRVPVKIFGCGTPKIDGVIDPTEWSTAGTETITVNSATGAVNGTLYMMNDNLNLYVAFKYPETVANAGSLGVEFDNNNNGIAFEEGDDVFVANNQVGFADDYRTMLPPCAPGDVCGPADTETGGTNDGKMAYHNDGTYSVYEVSHPLNTFDIGHDFALFEGATVGFFIELRIIDAGGTIYDTDYPGIGVYDQFTVSGCVPLVSACGTPTLDGIISAGEWPASGSYRLAVATPHRDWTPATLHVMNDSFNLYMALSYDQPALPGGGNGIAINFDNDDNKTYSVGDDAIVYNPAIGFFDQVWGSTSSDLDTNHGGTNDGAAALANDGVQTAFELSHPLNSGDADDFALSWAYPNNVIGYSIFLRMIETAGTFPDGFGDTTTRFKYLAICTPGPVSTLVDLGRGVDRLVSGGSLTTRSADPLRKDLSKANDDLAASRKKQAVNDLGNFVSDVQKLVRRGDLSDKLAQPLIRAANNAISQL